MPWSREEDGPLGLVKAVGRLLLYGLVTGVITLILAFALSAGQNRQAIDLLRDVRNSSRATACVLSLPADPETGRSMTAIAECFVHNGLPAPDFTGDRP